MDLRPWGVGGPTATAFVVADAVGAPSATVLLDAASNLRETEARRLEEAGGRAAVMLVLPLGLCFLPAFIATAVVPTVAVLVGVAIFTYGSRFLRGEETPPVHSTAEGEAVLVGDAD